MRKRSLITALTGVATAGMILVGATPAIAAPDNIPNPNGATEQVVGGGSDTTYELMQDLGTLYERTQGCNLVITQGVPVPPYSTLGPTNKCIKDTGAAWVLGDYSPNMLAGNADHDLVIDMYPVGSSNGVRQLDQINKTLAPGYLPPYGSLRYARSSSGYTGSSNQTNKRWIAFAQEGVTWIGKVGGQSDTGTDANRDLSTAELQNIYRGCALTGSPADDPVQPGGNTWITTWDLVAGGVPGDVNAGTPAQINIDIYAAQQGSGTRTTWDTFVGGASDKCIPDHEDALVLDSRVIFENNPNCGITKTNFPTCTATRPIADQNRAIFYVSTGRYFENEDASYFLGAIDGILPTATTIANGTFPNRRFVNVAYRLANDAPVAGVNDATKRYMGIMGDNDPTGIDDGASAAAHVGWLCKSLADAGVSPYNNESYYNQQTAVITDHGFARVPDGLLSRPATIAASPAGFTYNNSPCIVSGGPSANAGS